MGLAQKILDLKIAKRRAYVDSLNLSESAAVQMMRAVEQSDAELEQERAEHLENMFRIYTERLEDPRGRVQTIRRQHMETDLKTCGWITHVTTCKHGIITFVADPQTAAYIGKQLEAMLNVNPGADLSTYEDQLEIMITRIDRAEPKSSDSAIIIGGM